MKTRKHNSAYLRDCAEMKAVGMTPKVIGGAIDFVYDRLAVIDSTLLDGDGDRLSQLVELANLSAILGNLFRGGIVKYSGGSFKANGPHKYPDLLGAGSGCKDVEIKVALENNKPKGHLIKPGPHLIVRYVLGPEDGRYVRGERGEVAWIWEVRVGMLKEGHFNFSNTEGDSGKTAVVNKEGMDALQIVYADLDRSPHSPTGKTFASLNELFRRPAPRSSD